jgi:type I restriction enzyme M protein
LEENHVQQLFDWYTAFENVENYVKVVGYDEIAENDFNLNIPLYVEKTIEDNLPSVEEALKDLKTAWEESQRAEEKFKNLLKEFI